MCLSTLTSVIRNYGKNNNLTNNEKELFIFR
jgi:hypothetical protein